MIHCCLEEEMIQYCLHFFFFVKNLSHHYTSSGQNKAKGTLERLVRCNSQLVLPIQNPTGWVASHFGNMGSADSRYQLGELHAEASSLPCR